MPLREAICAASKKRRGVEYSPDEVVVSVGAKHTLFNLALALYNPGDEVIIPTPYWVSYPEQVKIAGATPVIIETNEGEGFRLTPKKLEAAITPKTKALLLCSPSNPTGAAYTGDQLRDLADVAAKHDFWIIVDEIYAQLVYEGFDQKSIIEVAPELRDRIIIVDGVSKTFAMTGWRIGWMLAPEHVCKGLQYDSGAIDNEPCHGRSTRCDRCTRGPLGSRWKPCVPRSKRRREIIVEGLNDIDGIRCRTPEGAFYAFANIEELIGKKAGNRTLENDIEVAGYLLEEARCALFPGQRLARRAMHAFRMLHQPIRFAKACAESPKRAPSSPNLSLCCY